MTTATDPSLPGLLAAAIVFLTDNIGAVLTALGSGVIGLSAGLITTDVQTRHSLRSTELRLRLEFYADLTAAVMETKNRFKEVERKAFSNYQKTEDGDYVPIEEHRFVKGTWDFESPDSASVVARQTDIEFQKSALRCHQLGSGIVMLALDIYTRRYNYFLHALENDKPWTVVAGFREEMESARELLIDTIIRDTRDMRVVAIKGLPRRIRKSDRNHFEELKDSVDGSLRERFEELERHERARAEEAPDSAEPPHEADLSHGSRLLSWLRQMPQKLR